MDKPGRPLGLSIAIVAAVLQFSMLPLVRILWVWGLRQQFDYTVLSGDGSAYGGGLSGTVDGWLVVEVLLALVFLAIAILTWRGKPAVMRSVFGVSVGLLVLLTIVQTLVVMRAPQTIATGMDSGAGLAQTLLWIRFVFSILLAVYVFWFLNRESAQAFFRGYRANT